MVVRYGMALLEDLAQLEQRLQEYQKLLQRWDLEQDVDTEALLIEILNLGKRRQ